MTLVFRRLHETRFTVKKTFLIIPFQDKIYPGCLAKSLKTMSTMYDKVETKVTRLIQKFSEHATNLSYIENGKTVQLQAAPIKDHLHVYTQVQLQQCFELTKIYTKPSIYNFFTYK
jgi:hypothetical protein